MKEVISGRVFEESGGRLTYRASWWWYIGGCCLALMVAGAGALIVARYLGDPNVYEGGSRHRGRPVVPGRAVDPAHQTFWQKTRYYGGVVAIGGLCTLLPLAYVCFGSEEQRKPVTIDREADRISRGGKVICRASAVVAIRLVTARSGTGVFARLKEPPWSTELDYFGRFGPAEAFAGRISTFLGVGLYDDPIVPRKPRKPGGRGFPVVIKNRQADPGARKA